MENNKEYLIVLMDVTNIETHVLGRYNSKDAAKEALDKMVDEVNEKVHLDDGEAAKIFEEDKDELSEQYRAFAGNDYFLLITPYRNESNINIANLISE